MAIITTPLGFQKPDGNELVRAGDNVITVNAAKAEELHQDARGRLTVIEAKDAEQDAALEAVPMRVAEVVAASSGNAVAINLIPNSAPAAALPTWPRSWGTSGNGTVSFVTDATAPSGKGYVRMAWTVNPGSNVARIQSPDFPATPEAMYSGALWVRSSIPNIMGAAMYFYDGAGTQVGSTQFNRLYKVPANEWTRLDISGTVAPAGAVVGRIGGAVNSGGSTYAVGNTLDASAAIASPGGTVYDWFDGDTANAYWEDVGRSASASITTATPFAAPYTTAPAAAGTRTGKYSPSHRLYIPNGADLGPTRRRIKEALAKATELRLAWIGHSIVAGQGATPGTLDNVRLLGHRAAQSGAATPGLVTAVNNTTVDARVTFDPEWTYSGTPDLSMQLHRRCNVAGKSYTTAFTHAGTEVEILTFGNGTALTYSIDGGAPVTITPSGSSTIQKTSVTGLANTKHTVTVTTTTSAGYAYLLGIALYQAKGLQVANFGYSGSFSLNWTPNAIGGSDIFYSPYRDVVTGWKADVVVVEIGANELIHDKGAAALATNLQTVVSSLKAAGADVVLVVDPPIYSATKTTWMAEFYPVLYNVADANKVPLVDFTAHWINRDVGAALDFYADQWHPSAKGYFDLNAVVSRALLP